MFVINISERIGESEGFDRDLFVPTAVGTKKIFIFIFRYILYFYVYCDLSHNKHYQTDGRLDGSFEII